MRILVVDDSKFVRIMTVKNLRKVGFSDILEAESGAMALESLMGVNAVLTDMLMPGMTGVELTRAIRARPDGNAMAILLASGQEIDSTTEAELRGCGIDGFIPKGMPGEALKALITTAVARRGSRIDS